MEEKLLAFIRDEYGERGAAEITADSRLLSTGLIDSFSLVALRAYIERAFGVLLPPPLMHPEMFDTVRQMAETIRGRL